MNRRSFLQTLTAVIVAPLVAIEAVTPKRPTRRFSSRELAELFQAQYQYNAMESCRLDILFGWAQLPPNACVVASA